MSKLSNPGLSTDRLIVGALLLIAASRFVGRRRERTLPYTPYTGPAGGWGSAKAVASILVRERVLLKGARLLMRQNKAKGFACVSCAWAKPKSHGLEFCENGAKATAWEIDAHRATPELFSRTYSYGAVNLVRLSIRKPRSPHSSARWDSTSDKYLPVRWKDAFREIGARLQVLQS